MAQEAKGYKMRTIAEDACGQCAEFKAETHRLHTLLYGPHELSLIFLNLAGYYKQLLLDKKKISTQISNPKRLMLQAQVDMVGKMLGKVLIGMDEENRKHTLKAAFERVGVVINIAEEPCPGHEATPVWFCLKCECSNGEKLQWCNECDAPRPGALKENQPTIGGEP